MDKGQERSPTTGAGRQPPAPAPTAVAAARPLAIPPPATLLLSTLLLATLLLAGLIWQGAAATGAAAQDVAPDSVTCDCDVAFDYADPQRYRYWRREAVTADLVARLTKVDGTYRVGGEVATELCEDVREERRGEPFRSVDMCIHLGEWLVRIRQEMRCGLSGGAVAGAECRLPDPDPDAGGFLTATGTGEGAADSLCNAFAHAVELRLAADIAAFEADSLHGLPDLTHSHSCRPQ